jgi:hypothetical protein
MRLCSQFADYTFATDEMPPVTQVPGRPKAGVWQNDVWHFEVNGAG